MAFVKRGHLWKVISGDLCMEVDLRAGGKMRRLLSGQSKRNFYFRDPRRQPAGQEYIQHDISGADECFPCVGKSEGEYYQDHGVLWDVAWDAYRQGQQLITRVSRPHGMPVIMTRIITASGPNRIHLDYTLVNIGKEAIPFIYSSHPILAVDPKSRVRLSEVKQLSVLGHNGLLKAGMVQTWPVANLKDNSKCRLDTDFKPDRKIAGKWFAKHCREARITFPKTKEILSLTWDQEHLPYMGLWLSLGIPLDPKVADPKHWNCVALEPCNYDHDLIQPKDMPELLPGEPFSFWMEWKLQSKWKDQTRIRRKLWLRRIKRILPKKK